MEFLILLIVLPGMIALIDFFGFLIAGRRIIGKPLLAVAETGSLIILPYLYADFGSKNDCCGDELDTAAFSPQHQLTIILVIVLSLASYFFSKFRRNISSPVVEVLINSFLLIGITLAVLMLFHTTELFFAFFGAAPIILLGVLMLAKNQRLFVENATLHERSSMKKFELIAWKILSAKPLVKFPILLILCLPVLLILSTVLLLFGQKPDSIVRAFTDTYKHGLSQWDYRCENVYCGGHYLCSVAANGHRQIVRPIRFGSRKGRRIICNRQLLISNAFEEVLEQQLPSAHRILRRHYNKVGNLIHRYYAVFEIKLVSDIIYVLMKPVEWLFLILLYTLDKNPEDRIAKQYLGKDDRLKIDEIKNNKENAAKTLVLQ